ncbi:MAG: type 4a pilus biogenesis protein PilO [Proteobacteria bacterium]|nr:type 4a pilus biogenesis protein PilO [Pseudomonadota bacterium]
MFDEIIFRYRNLSLPLRLLICAVIGALPKVLSYYDEIVVLEADLENATAREGAERSRLAEIRDKAKNIQQAEDNLNNTRDQLKKAETRLPNDVKIDEVVKQVGQAANAFNLKLVNLVPKGITVIPGEYSYDELKYQVVLNGKFSDLALWMDRLSQKDSRAYIKYWKIAKKVSESGNSSAETPAAPAQSSSTNGPGVKASLMTEQAGNLINSRADDLEALESTVRGPEVEKAAMEAARAEFKLELLVGLSFFRVSSGTVLADISTSSELQKKTSKREDKDNSPAKAESPSPEGASTNPIPDGDGQPSKEGV